MNILLVGDNEEERSTLADFLKEHGGHKIIEARNAQEAMDQIRMPGPIDYVITDFDLGPVMETGIHVLQLLRKERPQCKGVLTSASLRPVIKRAATDLGYPTFLKPEYKEFFASIHLVKRPPLPLTEEQ